MSWPVNWRFLIMLERKIAFRYLSGMKNITQYAIVSTLAALIIAMPAVAFGQDASVPGAVTTPHPTLEHISIEWAVEGDVNGNGEVTVRFRPEGASSWQTGLALVHVPAGANEGYSWTHKHSGSLFGLHPDTTYEIELTLSDPDGGGETRTITARTRPIPTVPDDARIINATTADAGDAIAAAQPGDVIVLAPGTYPSIYVRTSGEPGRPIVIRGSDADEVVVEGEIRMDGQAHVWIENLSVRGQIKFNNATGIVVRDCRIDAVGSTGNGIVSFSEGSTDGYFADNVITGQTVWAESSLGVNGDNIGDGIVVTGPGNVIEHNRITGFRDCISLQEGTSAHNQVSIDILNNDLDTCADDGIEADFAMGNVRVMRNRITNAFIGLSSQPSLGGPTWFVRNVMFNIIFQAFKPNRASVGDRLLHNTVVKPGDAMGVYSSRPWSRAVFRNNLFIGGVGGGEYNGFSNGSGRVLQVSTADEASCDFDYDGYGSIGTGQFSGQFGDTRFDSLEALRNTTSEAHAVSVDLSIFAQAIEFPENPFPGKSAPDLRLQQGAAIDRGVALATINDGFQGATPDLGAYEFGSALPQYGPRTGESYCGNNIVEAGEACDDGNILADDGCSADCMAVNDGGEGDAGLPDAGEVDPSDSGDEPGRDGGNHSSDVGNSAPDADGPLQTESDVVLRGTSGCGCRVGVGVGYPAGAFLGFAAFALLRIRRRFRT
jgi:cysteine-rich repeat protein